MAISDFASLILALTGALSLLYIARQVNVARQQAKGQFLLSLDDRFVECRPIMARLVTEPEFKPEGMEWTQVWSLMSVFEKINVMVEAKILEIGIVDRLHGFLLQVLIDNDAIYERLKATGAEWQDFVELCHAIARHKKAAKIDHHYREFLTRIQVLDKNARDHVNPWSM